MNKKSSLQRVVREPVIKVVDQKHEKSRREQHERRIPYEICFEYMK